MSQLNGVSVKYDFISLVTFANGQQVSSAGHGAVFLYGGVNKFKNMYAEGKLEGIKFNIERKKNVLQVN